MRNLLIIAVLLFSPGCISQSIKDKLSRNAAQLDGYVKLMDSDMTTPEDDQNLIRVMRVWTWSMNYAANDETPPDDILLILNSRGE